MDTEVLICGAGPTGLALALSLQRAGIPFIIIDQLPSGQNTSRAAVIHAHTLEVLDGLGAADLLLSAGLQLSKFSMRDRDRLLMGLSFDALATRHSCLLMIPQDRTERIFGDLLVARGSEVLWEHKAVAIAQTHGGVDVTVETKRGQRTISARYVVGCDGMQSLVRRTANIGFSGATYEESFVLADVRMDWTAGHDEVMLYFSPAGLLVVAPLPDAKTYRLVATHETGDTPVGVSELEALVRTRGPSRAAVSIDDILWASRFRLHHRVADHYRQGRLFVVGDAAHVHSPAGGQGMNTGLVDACVLGRVLADVVRGMRDASHLDTYEQLRRPAAQQVLGLAALLTNMALLKNPVARILRNTALSTARRIPAARRKLVANLSGLSRRAAAGPVFVE